MNVDRYSSYAAVAAFLGGLVLISSTTRAHWPDGRVWPHVRTATTSVPDRPGKQYSFEFTGEPIDSMVWSSVIGEPPGGQVGRLEDIEFAQAAAFANAFSKRQGLEICYDLVDCEGTPSDPDFGCERIRSGPISCRGFRLPTRREIDSLERADRHARFVQWSHTGQLVDARRVKRADEEPAEIVGFQVVRTVAYEPTQPDDG